MWGMFDIAFSFDTLIFFTLFYHLRDFVSVRLLARGQKHARDWCVYSSPFAVLVVLGSRHVACHSNKTQDSKIWARGM